MNTFSVPYKCRFHLVYFVFSAHAQFLHRKHFEDLACTTLVYHNMIDFSGLCDVHLSGILRVQLKSAAKQFLIYFDGGHHWWLGRGRGRFPRTSCWSSWWWWGWWLWQWRSQCWQVGLHRCAQNLQISRSEPKRGHQQPPIEYGLKPGLFVPSKFATFLF